MKRSQPLGAGIVWLPMSALILYLGSCAGAAASPRDRTLRVGPGQAFTTIAAVARVARDGDTIEIEAGDYVADVAVWDRARLSLRGVGGRPRLIAGGAAAEGKAIWVVRRGDITIENIEFTGARVPDRNGAGIRLEGGRLTVRDSRFVDNENGILVGNDPKTLLTIENSEFGRNGAGDGRSHDLYVGRIGLLEVSGSHFHHAHAGHLIKSRASESRICRNRIVDGSEGQASYELEFPNGGIAEVVGNLIGQSVDAQNATLLSYGAEGYVWPRNGLRLVGNTFVNERPEGGTFVRVAAPTRSLETGAGDPDATPLVYARSNRFVGPGQHYAGEVAIDAAGDSAVAASEAAQALRAVDSLDESAQPRSPTPRANGHDACAPRARSSD